MAGFNDFVQTELPLRPSVATDGAAGQILVRSTNPLAPREMVWANPATGGGTIATGTGGLIDGGSRLAADDLMDGGGRV